MRFMKITFELDAVHLVYAVCGSKPHKTEVQIYARFICGPCGLSSFIVKTAPAYFITQKNILVSYD